MRPASAGGSCTTQIGTSTSRTFVGPVRDPTTMPRGNRWSLCPRRRRAARGTGGRGCTAKGSTDGPGVPSIDVATKTSPPRSTTEMAVASPAAPGPVHTTSASRSQFTVNSLYIAVQRRDELFALPSIAGGPLGNATIAARVSFPVSAERFDRVCQRGLWQLLQGTTGSRGNARAKYLDAIRPPPVAH